MRPTGPSSGPPCASKAKRLLADFARMVELFDAHVQPVAPRIVAGLDQHVATRQVAPADGLYLTGVSYPSENAAK